MEYYYFHVSACLELLQVGGTMVQCSEQAATLEKLGKHKTGVGCLYINKLADVDLKVLKGMIEAALKRK